jgi:HK97 family phage major capsid protein
MAGIDVNRTTAGVTLPPAVSAEIWQSVQEGSAVMRLSNQIPLPGGGVSVNIITGDPVAQWVAETGLKPTSRPTLGTKLMRPYKIAVKVPFSNEFRRDLPGLYNALVGRLPGALARTFDATVFTGSAPGADFDVLSGATAVGIAGDTYAGLIAADAAVATAGATINGWALAPQARGLLLSSTDGNGRPLFINNVVTDGAVPALLGAPTIPTPAVYEAGTPAQIGFAGDWTQANYGTVEGVQVRTSADATITDSDGTTQINLWERNMFAVLAEIEVGFRVRDDDAFVRLTDAAAA